MRVSPPVKQTLTPCPPSPFHSLSMRMNLGEVLAEAERLFYKYCRLSITRGFSEVDL